MKKILLALLLLPTGLLAQGLTFKIKPYVVQTFAQGVLKKSDTSNKLQLSLCGIGRDSACVNYALYKTDGSLFEVGQKSVPKEVLDIIIADTINITYLNQVLSFWNVEAIRQE